MKQDNIYARWMAGKATKEEIEALSKGNDLDWLGRIKAHTDGWSLPEVPEGALAHIISQPKNEGKIYPLFSTALGKTVAVAAVLLLAIGIGTLLTFLLNTTETIATAGGETRTVVLPDQSIITLKENSSIRFKKGDGFLGQRAVAMKGNVLFKVTKKGKFEVKFALGTVQVMGTAFEVDENPNSFSVKCTEGKVLVTNNLTPGSVWLLPNVQTRFVADSAFVATESRGDGDFVYFSEQSLETVAAYLAKNYGLNVQFKGQIDTQRKFSGKVPSNDLTKAMQVVGRVMNIRYELQPGEPAVLVFYP